MAMTADAMVTLYKSKLSALGVTFNHANSETYMKALFESVIEEIVANATIVTTGGAPDGEHSGNVSG